MARKGVLASIGGCDLNEALVHNEEGAAGANGARKPPRVEPGHTIRAVELGKCLQHAAVRRTGHVRLDDCLGRVDGLCRGERGRAK